MDLVEIDLHAPQIYGQTWFTLSARASRTTPWASSRPPNASTVIAALDVPIRSNRSALRESFPGPTSIPMTPPDRAGADPRLGNAHLLRVLAFLPKRRIAPRAEIAHSRAEPHLLSGTITNNLPFNCRKLPSSITTMAFDRHSSRRRVPSHRQRSACGPRARNSIAGSAACPSWLGLELRHGELAIAPHALPSARAPGRRPVQ